MNQTNSSEQKPAQKKAAPRKKASAFNLRGVITSAVVTAVVLVPIVYLSSASYSFFSPADSSVKVAFKHSGKRISDCDENEMIRKEGERYREQLKGERRVQMNIEKLANCPRERFPVVVSVTIDGNSVLNKVYSPTGFKKDMASYVSEEFIVAAGAHNLEVTLSDTGKKEAPDYILKETVELKPGEVRLVTYDDRDNKLVVE